MDLILCWLIGFIGPDSPLADQLGKSLVSKLYFEQLKCNNKQSYRLTAKAVLMTSVLVLTEIHVPRIFVASLFGNK